MRLPLIVVLGAAWLVPTAFAQKLDLNLDHLISKAKEHTVVDLEGDMLKKALSQTKSEKLGKMLEGIQGVHVRSFEFGKKGDYSQADLDSIRKQLQAPGWSRIVSTKDEEESCDVYVMSREGKTVGFAVLAAEPEELTVVNIVGDVPLDKVSELVSSSVSYDLSKLKLPEAK